MRSSFWHLPKRCRCGELLCRRSKVRPDRSFRIRCLRCRRARRKQRVCLLYKSTSRFQPQNQRGHRSALQRSEVRLPPKDSAAFRFCCCALRFRCRTFKFRCFPCVFVCNAIVLRLTAFRFGFCAIGFGCGSVVFGGNAQGFICLRAASFVSRVVSARTLSASAVFRLFSAFTLGVSASIRPFSEAALLFPLPRVRLRRNFARFRS